MKTVIFVCTHNAGRSQIAAALFNQYADPSKAIALSAGTLPAEKIYPNVVTALKQIGLDVEKQKPTLLTKEWAKQVDYVVTMCAGIDESCPYIPAMENEKWSIEDVQDKPVEEITNIQDVIKNKVLSLIKKLKVEK